MYCKHALQTLNEGARVQLQWNAAGTEIENARLLEHQFSFRLNAAVFSELLICMEAVMRQQLVQRVAEKDQLENLDVAPTARCAKYRTQEASRHHGLTVPHANRASSEPVGRTPAERMRGHQVAQSTTFPSALLVDSNAPLRTSSKAIKRVN